jgi:hypothetical protein
VTRPDSPDARMEQARAQAALVCHDDQITVWADEVKMELLDHLREPADYEEVLSLDAAVKAAIRHVVDRAFGHPALPPEGYVIVPVEPSEAMVEAALNDPTATHDRVRFRDRAAANVETEMVASILRAALTGARHG